MINNIKEKIMCLKKYFFWKVKHRIKLLVWGNDLDIDYLRKCGCKIGDRVTFFSRDIHIDMTRPFLIEIGNDVNITKGVTILTHGYDFAVLRNVYNETIGSSGKVTIGNNVFIGMNSTILKGTTIGDNVIIGAGSIVNKKIPSNCVAVGNPAKPIMTLDEYYYKRKKIELQEAVLLAKAYFERYGKKPDPKVFHEFFFLFAKRDKAYLDKYGFNYSIHIENPKKFLEHFIHTEPLFPDFEDFLEYCDLESVEKETK